MMNEEIRRERQRQRRKKVIRMRILTALILAAVVLLAVGVVKFINRDTKISVKVQSVALKSGEDVPKFQTKVTCTGNENRILDKKTKYRVKDLVSDFKKGKYYTLSFSPNNQKDGKYEITLTFDEAMKKKLDGKWSKKVSVDVKQGTLTPAKYKVDPEKPMIALTFDDGPGPRTGELLDVLEKHGARATFFMVGERTEEYPEIIKRMWQTGNELGNHTAFHKSMTKITDEEINEQIQIVENNVAKATGGFSTTVIRPPYGAVNEHVQEVVKQPLIMWNIDTLDWKTKNVQSTINTTMNKAHDGAIVLMHDIHSTSIDAAIKLVPMLIEKGYQLVTVSELAEAKGIPLEAGERYFSFNEQ